ncbi:MAG: PLD nuclease N-terminal domain-containing protein [Pseudomonadota bacterium]
MDPFAIASLAVLALNSWAFLSILSSTADIWPKTLWIAVVLCLPVIGFGVWLAFGPKSAGPLDR